MVKAVRPGIRGPNQNPSFVTYMGLDKQGMKSSNWAKLSVSRKGSACTLFFAPLFGQHRCLRSVNTRKANGCRIHDCQSAIGWIALSPRPIFSSERLRLHHLRTLSLPNQRPIVRVDRGPHPATLLLGLLPNVLAPCPGRPPRLVLRREPVALRSEAVRAKALEAFVLERVLVLGRAGDLLRVRAGLLALGLREARDGTRGGVGGGERGGCGGEGERPGFGGLYSR